MKFLGLPPPRISTPDFPPSRLGVVDDRGGFVDVAERVDLELAAVQACGGEVHADRAVSGAGGIDRHGGLKCRGEQAAGRPAQRLMHGREGIFPTW